MPDPAVPLEVVKLLGQRRTRASWLYRGQYYVDVPELLREAGVEVTPENVAHAMRVMREKLAKVHPDLPVRVNPDVPKGAN